MSSAFDDSIRLTNVALLRKEQASQIMEQVRSLVEASGQAVEESRKLLARNDALLKQLLRRPEPARAVFTVRQLEDLAALVAEARGGHAFIWHPSDPLPTFDKATPTSIQ